MKRRLVPALLCVILVLPAATAGQAPEARGVRVLDTGGSKPVPCPPVDAKAEPYVKGGCRANAYDFSMVLSVRTLFGAVHFGDCTTSFATTIAADGRFWLDDLKIGGASPCNDVWACASPAVIAMRKKRTDAPPRGKVPPWRGRLKTADDGSFRGSLGFCIDTCLGRYEGAVDVRLVELGDGDRKLVASSEGVGTGSLEVDAEWDMMGEDLVGSAALDLRPAAAR